MRSEYDSIVNFVDSKDRMVSWMDVIKVVNDTLAREEALPGIVGQN